MKKISSALILSVFLVGAATLSAGPKEKERTPAQKAAYGLCVKRCNDDHSSCEKGASALKKASCANNLRVCEKNCDEKY